MAINENNGRIYSTSLDDAIEKNRNGKATPALKTKTNFVFTIVFLFFHKREGKINNQGKPTPGAIAK